jgi:hypothetical protein
MRANGAFVPQTGVGPLTRRLFYALKPLLPRGVQMAARRVRARGILPTVGAFWPIDPGTANPPSGWEGWPGHKRFALVLTHDVERLRGVSRTLRLARLEKELGMRSSFNFVPERYPTDPRLRRILTEDGFEVGVHDLTHDGRLFSSRGTFDARSPRINSYLREWGSVGFRAAAMYHNLDWIGDLDVEYDCSTFDTEPFEPQPDGAGTIFPFWVPRRGRPGGFVELPYTLPQDMTLFVILGEKGPETWRRKLDWIAERGGMALLDTHPDYMSPDGERPRVDEYPSGFYRSFLEYVAARHAGQFWHVLPRELAQFWKARALSGTPGAGPGGGGNGSRTAAASPAKGENE